MGSGWGDCSGDLKRNWGEAALDMSSTQEQNRGMILLKPMYKMA